MRWRVRGRGKMKQFVNENGKFDWIVRNKDQVSLKEETFSKQKWIIWSARSFWVLIWPTSRFDRQCFVKIEGRIDCLEGSKWLEAFDHQMNLSKTYWPMLWRHMWSNREMPRTKLSFSDQLSRDAQMMKSQTIVCLVLWPFEFVLTSNGKFVASIREGSV
jgi:hypothetical protein